MAFSASTWWTVLNAGSDGTTGFGGGFDPGQSAGMATDGAATVATGSSPVFTSASYNFVAGDVGAWLYINSGTNWTPGYYQIASVASNAATLSAGIGAATLQFGGLNTVAGCATTASPTAATWSVDYSNQTSAQVTYSDMVIGATTTQYTSVLNSPGVNLVGNIIAVSAGTGFTVQRVAITAVSAGTATCDKSLGTTLSTGGVGKLGGALATPGMAGGLMVASNYIWVGYNATPYTSTSATSNITSGKVALVGGTSALLSLLRGFHTIRGDFDGTRPTLKWGVNAVGSALVGTAASVWVENIIIDGNRANFTNTVGINCPSVANNTYFNVKVMNCSSGGFITSGSDAAARYIACEVTGCATTSAMNISNSGDTNLIDCWIHDNTITGIAQTGTGTMTLTRCLITNNTGASHPGLSVTASGSRINALNSTFYGNGGDGIGSTVSFDGLVENCHFENNGGWGVNLNTASQGLSLTNNSYYNNTSGTYNPANLTMRNIFSQITLTSTAFNNAAGNDFSLNNTAGGGAALRAASSPATIVGSSTNNYLDIGAAQHQDSGGSNTFIYTIME